MNRLRQHFFTGMAVLLPITLTFLVFQYVWNLVDSLFVNALYNMILPFEVDRNIAVFLIKTLILIFAILIVCLIGIATRLFLVKRLIRVGENLVGRVPMVNRVYGLIKEVSHTFFSGKKQSDLFRKAVLIEYPRPGLYSIAFITKSSHPTIDKMTKKEVVSVFVPTTPNPTSGVLLFVPKKDVKEVPISVEEAVKLVISAGTLTGKIKPERIVKS